MRKHLNVKFSSEGQGCAKPHVSSAHPALYDTAANSRPDDPEPRTDTEASGKGRNEKEKEKKRQHKAIRLTAKCLGDGHALNASSHELAEMEQKSS